MKPPKPTPPDSAERQYNRFLNSYVQTYIKFMREGLKDLVPDLKEEAGEELPRADSIFTHHSQHTRMDANVEKVLRGLFESVQSRLMQVFPDTVLRKWAMAMVGQVNRVSKKNTAKAARVKRKGVEIEIEPLLRDGELTPYFQNVVDENVGLIRSIPEEKQAIFKNKMVALITSDAPQSTIREAIEDQFGYSRSKAKMIARDQVGKLNGKLHKYRQQQIGGKGYFWRGAMDAREREDHKRLEGKRFTWDNPPIINRSTGARGHPGDDYQCRCYAEMDMSDVID